MITWYVERRSRNSCRWRIFIHSSRCQSTYRMSTHQIHAMSSFNCGDNSCTCSNQCKQVSASQQTNVHYICCSTSRYHRFLHPFFVRSSVWLTAACRRQTPYTRSWSPPSSPPTTLRSAAVGKVTPLSWTAWWGRRNRHRPKRRDFYTCRKADEFNSANCCRPVNQFLRRYTQAGDNGCV